MSETQRLAKAFKKYRADNNLSLRQIQAITGMSNAFLNQFENEKTSISFENAITLQKLMGLTPNEQIVLLGVGLPFHQAINVLRIGERHKEPLMYCQSCNSLKRKIEKLKNNLSALKFMLERIAKGETVSTNQIKAKLTALDGEQRLYVEYD